MKKIAYIFLALFLGGTFCSCNNWLDVKPDTQEEEKNMFTSESGFRDALTGCYMTLASTDSYGKRLTMTNIESLADLWYMTSAQYHSDDYNLTMHDYTNDDSKTAIKSIYNTLFNTIVQANMVIKHIAKSTVFEDESIRKVIEGEAYAIRALCQFDVLRLFGQMPQNSTLQVSLPYSETTSIDEMPAYYSFNDYIAKLESDFNMATSLLKDNDPIFRNTFDQLNSPSSTADNTFMYYRQFRLNYWAVIGLQARMYLYIGNTAKAYELTKSIINAKTVNGNTVIKLSGVSDLTNGYYACPSECLFALSKYNILDYTAGFFIGNGTDNVYVDKHYVVSEKMLTNIFSGANTASNNRYLSVWNHETQTSSGAKYPSITKYYYTTTTPNLMTKHQLIPMLRMSEIYLIAMETTSDLAEANSLYKTYMESQNELITTDKYTSLEAVRSDIPALYLREFYGEGQMFYTYKRFATTTIPLNFSFVETMNEAKYIIPLPETEYNPATK